MVAAVTRNLSLGLNDFKLWLVDARARDEFRVLALNNLPQGLIDAMPSLRYLAIGDVLENEDLKGDKKPWEERKLGYIGKICWWRTKREEGRAELEEIPREVGEEAQRLIERPDLDEGSSLEGKWFNYAFKLVVLTLPY